MLKSDFRIYVTRDEVYNILREAVDNEQIAYNAYRMMFDKVEELDIIAISTYPRGGKPCKEGEDE